MRNTASLWWVILITVASAAPLAAQGRFQVGKEPAWELWGGEPAAKASISTDAASTETPNQRRRRLGLPIESSFPALEYGRSEETPNQRRHRVELAQRDLPSGAFESAR
jgi:hypothetical protein